MLDIPVCPECGGLAELLDDEIYCEECTGKYIDWIMTILGRDGRYELAAQLQQDRKLGIGLERKLESGGPL